MNKLYYDSAYIKEFEAQVLSCQEGKKASSTGTGDSSICRSTLESTWYPA